MSDIFGCLGDELGGAEEALALASFLTGGAGGSYGASGLHAGHPLLRRSRLYFQRREQGKPVGLDNQSVTYT